VQRNRTRIKIGKKLKEFLEMFDLDLTHICRQIKVFNTENNIFTKRYPHEETNDLADRFGDQMIDEIERLQRDTSLITIQKLKVKIETKDAATMKGGSDYEN
jgi:hypothetical protein